MSGQPYRYVKDIENFRKDYMTSLGLRANLDDMNLQANKNYKETGAIPPQSTMKDMRTTSEILADTEKLKLSLIEEFKSVATTQMSQAVIQKVIQSPFNADGSFLVFIAQNAPELVSQLKKKYKFGILGDDNDVEQMVSFLVSIFSRTKDMSASVKNAFDRPTNAVTSGLQPSIFTQLQTEYEDIQFKLLSRFQYDGNNRNVFFLLSKIRDQMDLLSEVLNQTKYNKLKEIFLEASIGHTPRAQAIINYQGYNEFNEFTETLPSASSLRLLFEQLKKSEKNDKPDLTFTILQNISSLLPEPTRIANMSQLVDELLSMQGVPIDRNPASVRGFGIKKKRVGRPIGSGLVKPISERIDHTKGIKQGHIHVPFGKYILNKNKLDSDLVYFKHVKGYGVKGFPMAKVSKNLGSVLRTIIGGGVPKFEDLQGLTNEEKEYLHKVANKAGIMDKISIPTPSKDKLEQDIHQFEVMKGELLAGNDSPELIKKFKLILLRLSKNGTIPKREATELLEDLIILGH